MSTSSSTSKSSTTSSSTSNSRISNFASQLLNSRLNITKSSKPSAPVESRSTQGRSISLENERVGKSSLMGDISFNSEENVVYFDECERTIAEITELSKKVTVYKNKQNQTSKLKMQIVSDAATTMKKMIEKTKPTSSSTSSLSPVHPLMISYDMIMSHISRNEHMMSKIQDLYSSNKDSLLSQSDHLRSRLVSCLRHNKIIYHHSKKRYDDSRKLADMLTKYSSYMKEMQTFYDEILIMKSRQSSGYVSWALRLQQNDTTSSSSSSSNKDDDVYDKTEAYHRYRKLIKAKKFSLMCLVYHSREHDRCSSLVKNAEHALHQYSSSLDHMGFNSKVPSYFNHSARADFDDDEDDDHHDDDDDDDDKMMISSKPPSSSSSSSSSSARNRAASYPMTSSNYIDDDSDDELKLIISSDTSSSSSSSDHQQPKKYVNFGQILVEDYDHSLCDDCSLVTTMADDACMRFKNIYQQSYDAAKMLQKLEHQREEMIKLHVIIAGIIESEQHHA